MNVGWCAGIERSERVRAAGFDFLEVALGPMNLEDDDAFDAAKAAEKAVPFYRDRFGHAGARGGDLRSLDDLARFPFTTKQDLRDHYPFGLLAVPMKDVVRIHASSGTTGKPTVVAYTRDDLTLWSDLMARTYAAAGVTDSDVVHNAYGYGLFTGGLGFHYGAERIGAAVIPMSGGNTKRQLMLMRDFGSTVLCCTPSYALLLAEAAVEDGIDVASFPLRVGLFGAEPGSEEMRREIQARLGIQALNVYGLSEVIGPGVAVECAHQRGLHIFDEHFVPEVIDPATGAPLPAGETGELVLTCVTKQALPLETMSFETRDRIGYLTLNRPAILNAMNYQGSLDLIRAAEFIRDEAGVRMVVIRGNGRAFCTGIDLKQLSAGETPHKYYENWDRTLRVLEQSETLVICAMQGYSLGGGFQLALAADIRIATPDCQMGLPAIKEGIVPGLGTFRLPRYIGLGRAKWMTLSGENVDGRRAYEMGLVDHLVSAEHFDAAVADIVESYPKNCSEGTIQSKMLLNMALDMGHGEFFEEYLRRQRIALGSPDHREAMAAYRERRQPQFSA